MIRDLLAAPAAQPAVRISAPARPGIYAWWSREPLIGGIAGTPHGEHFLYYLGKADDSLRARLERHIGGTTRGSTLRTTFAALWDQDHLWTTECVRTNPNKSEQAPKFRTVLASGHHEAALSELMGERLLVSWVEHLNPAQIEQTMIERLRPPLNLDHNKHHPSYLQVKALRSSFNASATPNPVAPNPEGESELGQLQRALSTFAGVREWEQFHTPKNLAMALAGEVGELLAEIQWLTEEQLMVQVTQEPLRARLADEIADVLMYLVRFADVCGIDPLSAAWDKIERNEARYPADKARGNARKYTDLANEGQA